MPKKKTEKDISKVIYKPKKLKVAKSYVDDEELFEVDPSDATEFVRNVMRLCEGYQAGRNNEKETFAEIIKLYGYSRKYYLDLLYSLGKRVDQ